MDAIIGTVTKAAKSDKYTTQPWPGIQTHSSLVHATATTNACDMLEWDEDAGQLVINLNPNPSEDYAPLKLMWFGVPGAMSADALKYFGHRYGNVEFVIDPAQLANYSAVGVLEAREYQQEISCPLLVEVLEGAEQKTFKKGQILFQWPVGHERIHAEVAATSQSPEKLAIQKIVFVSHPGGICVTRRRKLFCFDCEHKVPREVSHAMVVRALINKCPTETISHVVGSLLPGLTDEDLRLITGNFRLHSTPFRNLSKDFFTTTMSIECASYAEAQEVASKLLVAALMFHLPADWEKTYTTWQGKHEKKKKRCQLAFDVDRVQDEMKRLAELATAASNMEAKKA